MFVHAFRADYLGLDNFRGSLSLEKTDLLLLVITDFLQPFIFWKDLVKFLLSRVACLLYFIMHILFRRLYQFQQVKLPTISHSYDFVLCVLIFCLLKSLFPPLRFFPSLTFRHYVVYSPIWDIRPKVTYSLHCDPQWPLL